MPINSINSNISLHKAQMPLKSSTSPSFAGSDETKEKVKKSLPYVAGAILLAGMGFVGANYFKNKKAVKETVDKGKKAIQEIKNDAQKAADDVKPQKAAEEVKPAEQAVNTLNTEKKTEIAEETKNTLSDMKNSMPAAAEKTEKQLLTLETLKEINAKYKAEAERIINENTHNGFLDLNIVDKVARDFAKDTKREHNLHQAANLIEQGHIKAYIKTNPENVKEGLEKIIFRLTNESQALTEIYSQMPREQAIQRLSVFQEALGGAEAKFKGMQLPEFANKVTSLLK